MDNPPNMLTYDFGIIEVFFSYDFGIIEVFFVRFWFYRGVFSYDFGIIEVIFRTILVL